MRNGIVVLVLAMLSGGVAMAKDATKPNIVLLLGGLVPLIVGQRAMHTNAPPRHRNRLRRAGRSQSVWRRCRRCCG